MLFGGMITYHENDGSCPPSSLGVDAKGISYMGSLVSCQIQNALRYINEFLRQHEDQNNLKLVALPCGSRTACSFFVVYLGE